MSDLVLLPSLCFEHRNYTPELLMNVLSWLMRKVYKFAVLLSLPPQAMNENCIMQGHETAASQLKWLHMNAIGMHIKAFFSTNSLQ